MFPQCGWECSFTYSEIYMESQDTLNNMLHNVTSQKTRIDRTLVADSRSQWENGRPITGVQSALNNFSISYTSRLMSFLYITMHTMSTMLKPKKYRKRHIWTNTRKWWMAGIMMPAECLHQSRFKLTQILSACVLVHGLYRNFFNTLNPTIFTLHVDIYIALV